MNYGTSDQQIDEPKSNFLANKKKSKRYKELHKMTMSIGSIIYYGQA